MTFQKRTLFILCLFVLTMLPACDKAPTPPAAAAGEQPWRMADLRALEAPNTPDTAHDLIAAYARLTATDLELRVDLLGSPDPFDYDLYVAYQSGPDAGAEPGAHFPLAAQPDLAWDLAEAFPARGLPRAFRADGSPAAIRPRINRLSVQDAAVVRLSLAELRQGLGSDPRQAAFQVFLTRPGERQVIDSIGPLRVDGPSPSGQARVLLAFWNTLPAATPAQALRRWDGAHTGPYGQRHGLQVLLQAARRTQTPVALLDLKQPDSLAALGALGGLPLVQALIKNGLALLPDVIYGGSGAEPVSLDLSRQAGQRDGLADSPFLYGSLSGPLPAGTRAAFARMNGAAGPRQWNGVRLIPLPGGLDLPPGTEEAGEEGLTLPVRQALLQLALKNQPGDLLALGGDLPRSPWGDSLIAGPSMEYLAGHPWLKVVSGADLLPTSGAQPTVEIQPGQPDCPDLLCASQGGLSKGEAQNQATIRAAIQGAAADPAPGGSLFRDLAWQAYLRLSAPAADEALQSSGLQSNGLNSDRLNRLRAGQLGEVIGPILAAADWNAAPPASAQAECDRDLNWDGAPECTLADGHLFLALDPRGGLLVYMAARVNNRPVQIIAARAQYALGLGDPLELTPERGPAGDPQGIPGAFAPPLDPFQPDDWQPYTAETQPGRVTLTQPRTGLRKTYRLTADGVQVSVDGSTAQAVIPLALTDSTWTDTQTRNQTLHPESFAWGLTTNADALTGASIQVRSQNATLEGHGFSEGRDLLFKPEDPNLSYPPGHFIPFPLAVVTIRPLGSYSVEIKLLSKP